MTRVWQKFGALGTARGGVWFTLGVVLGVTLVVGLGGCQTRDESAPAPGHGHGMGGDMVGHGAAHAAASGPRSDADMIPTPVVDLRTVTDVSGLVERLVDRRVVYLGEQHDRYEQHLLQLAVIRGLHERGVPLAIGLEQFQRRFQPVLDDFVAGRIDTREMLRRSEYYQRWRFDYRLYRPILDFARAQGIPLVALNAEVELTRRVGAVGLAGLTPAERAQLPAEYAPADAVYRAHLDAVFRAHPMVGDRAGGDRDFEHFVEVQLSWDETMAETAARYLAAHPSRHMVVLVGAGHVAGRYGIPERVQRRAPVPDAVVLLGPHDAPGAEVADWMLMPRPARLPAAGKMGVMMVDSEDGVRVAEVVAEGAAARAGVRAGDVMTRIDDEDIGQTGDVRIALFDRGPGEEIVLAVRRGAEAREFRVTLKAH